MLCAILNFKWTNLYIAEIRVPGHYAERFQYACCPCPPEVGQYFRAVKINFWGKFPPQTPITSAHYIYLRTRIMCRYVWRHILCTQPDQRSPCKYNCLLSYLRCLKSSQQVRLVSALRAMASCCCTHVHEYFHLFAGQWWCPSPVRWHYSTSKWNFGCNHNRLIYRLDCLAI